MDLGILHGLTSLPGRPRLWMVRDEVEVVQPKLVVFATNERCNDTSPQSTLALIYRCFGFAIASTITLIGTIANQMVSFLT